MKTVLTLTRFSTGISVSLQPKGRFCKKSRRVKFSPIYTKEQYTQAKGR